MSLQVDSGGTAGGQEEGDNFQATAAVVRPRASLPFPWSVCGGLGAAKYTLACVFLSVECGYY